MILKGEDMGATITETALQELHKVWAYERTIYDHAWTAEEIAKIDAKTTSYGIVLGNLRKIFEEKDDRVSFAKI